MSAAETYVPRLKARYEEEIRPVLQDELGLDSIMQVPKLAKITLNMGVGDAKTDAKLLDSAVEELSIIAGQRAEVRRARKSIAAFKLASGTHGIAVAAAAVRAATPVKPLRVVAPAKPAATPKSNGTRPATGNGHAAESGHWAEF